MVNNVHSIIFIIYYMLHDHLRRKYKIMKNFNINFYIYSSIANIFSYNASSILSI